MQMKLNKTQTKLQKTAATQCLLQKAFWTCIWFSKKASLQMYAERMTVSLFMTPTKYVQLTYLYYNNNDITSRQLL